MNQSYFKKNWGKELKCAKKKRRIFWKICGRDVREAISKLGESWEEVMERLGTPEELAG